MQDSDGYWDGFKIRIENDGTDGWYKDFPPGVRHEGTDCPGHQGRAAERAHLSPFRLKPDGTPIEPPFQIGVPARISANGFLPPVPYPKALPTTTIFENAGDAFFVKYIPETASLLDLNALALNT